MDLGPVDGFNQDQTTGKTHNSIVAFRGLLTSHRHAFETFQLPDGLLNPGSGPVKQTRKNFGRSLTFER